MWFFINTESLNVRAIHFNKYFEFNGGGGGGQKFDFSKQLLFKFAYLDFYSNGIFSLAERNHQQ